MSKIGMGRKFLIVVDQEGDVWGCGNNSYGQLGVGDNEPRSTPEKNSKIGNIDLVSCWSHTLFLDIQGDVWSCGLNQSGQLGTITDNPNEPEKIQNLPKIKTIAAGPRHSLLVDIQGNVWVCGYTQSSKVQFKFIEPQALPNLNNIVAAEAGEYHSIFLDAFGLAYCYGSNLTFALGLYRTNLVVFPPRRTMETHIISQISTGLHHSLFLDQYGSVHGSGSNIWSRLESRSYVPFYVIEKNPPILSVSAKGYQCLLLDSEGVVWIYGDGSTKFSEQQMATQLNIPVAIAEVYAGYNNSVFLDTEGNMWGFGANQAGELGTGDTASIPAPERLFRWPTLACRRKRPTKSARFTCDTKL